MNFVVIFQGSTLSWPDLLIVITFIILYLSLIAIVVLERTKPISLLTDEQLQANEAEYGQVPVKQAADSWHAEVEMGTEINETSSQEELRSDEDEDNKVGYRGKKI